MLCCFFSPPVFDHLPSEAGRSFLLVLFVRILAAPLLWRGAVGLPTEGRLKYLSFNFAWGSRIPAACPIAGTVLRHCL